ncbi:MAG: hypothetical protein M3268_08040 [Acidobacteriota bacterium]|nr:hypothetical protein [Acidobacteriota bacterium]
MTLKRTPALALVITSLLCASLAHAAAARDKKKKEAAPRGVPVLWRDPGDVASRDTFFGPGGRAMRPATGRLTVVKTEEGGYSPKLRVRDAAGRVWVAKMGKEAQSETAAVRLLWAVGYVTEINYLVPCAHFRGAVKLAKEVERCAGGGYANVRFEARPANVKRFDKWKWDDNPFEGTREFQGLKTLMVLLNNWDIKDDNNVILQTRRGGRTELDYAISDLGATFGKTGGLPVFWRITRSRNDPEGYSHDRFIEGVRSDGRVNFEFQGKKSGFFNDVTVEQARWIGGLLNQLSDLQLVNVFRAANYTPEEIHILRTAVRRRIDQLVTVSR